MANPTAEEAILTKLAQAPSFHPAGAKLFVPDWTLDPGDVVTVTAKDNVNDPDETPTSYNVPIYSLNLTWNGASRVEIESTGNQQREPLSALRRKEYQTGRRGYGRQQELENEFKEFETWQEQTDETIGTYAAQFVDILGDGTNEGRLTIAETAIEQTASDATITAQAAGILLDSDGHPILDERGKYQYDPNAADTTLTARIDVNATNITTEVTRATGAEGTLSGRITTEAGKISQIVTAVGSNGEVTAGSIILAINKTKDGSATSTTTITADAINLEGYVTASYVDATILKVDSLTSSSGYSGSIAVSTSVTAGSVIADNFYFKDTPNNEQVHTRPIQLLESGYLANISALAIGTAGILNLTHYHDIDIEEVTSGANAGKMKVTIGHAVATSDTANHVDYFKIADTTAYRNGVASAKLQVGLNAMGYTEIQGTNYPPSQTIFTDTTGRTDASGADANLHRDITLSLDVDDDYVYMKHGSDIIARIENTGGGGGGSYYATFLDNITLESTDIGDAVTKYSIANYSDGHRDSAANTRIVIDASRVYSAGVTAGLGGVVDVVKSNWNLGYCTFTPSAGSGQSQEVLLNYAPVKPGFSSANGEATINILDDNTSVNLPIRLVLARRQFGLYNYACLFKNGDTLTQGNVLAKFQLDGSAVISDVASILQNGRITYQDADKKIADIPVTAYDGEDNALLSTTITADVTDSWNAGFESGYTEGAGISILDEYSTTISSNNTTVMLLPSDKGNYNVMSSAKVKVEVPPVYRIAQRVASTIVLPNTHKATETIFGNHVMYDVGPNSDNFNVTIDASAVYAQGVTDGASINIKAEERRTISEVQTNITITPTSVGGVSYGAMQKAVVYVNLPRIKDNEDLGDIQVSASSTSLTVNPTGGYGAMKKATGTIKVSYENPSISSSVFISGNATSPIRTLTLHSGNHGYIQIDSTANGKQTTKYVQINVT